MQAYRDADGAALWVGLRLRGGLVSLLCLLAAAAHLFELLRHLHLPRLLVLRRRRAAAHHCGVSNKNLAGSRIVLLGTNMSPQNINRLSILAGAMTTFCRSWLPRQKGTDQI